MYTKSGNNKNTIHFYFIFERENNPIKKKFISPIFVFRALVAAHNGNYWVKRYKKNDLEQVVFVVLEKDEGTIINNLGLKVEKIFTPLKYDTYNKKIKINIFFSVTLLPFLVMIAVPLPALILNVFFAINIIYALILLIFVFCSNNVKNNPMFPLSFLFSIIFNIALNIKTSHIIFTKGTEFNDWLINKLFSFINGSENEKILFAIGIFILIFEYNLIVVLISCNRISRLTIGFPQMYLRVKNSDIDIEYNSGTINLEEAEQKYKKVQREDIFWENLDTVSKFISSNEKIRIFIIFISFFGVILINVLQNSGSINDVIKTYSPLIIGNGIVCILPAFLTSIAMWIVVKREWIVIKNKINKQL